eukprot:g38389.t1
MEACVPNAIVITLSTCDTIFKELHTCMPRSFCSTTFPRALPLTVVDQDPIVLGMRNYPTLTLTGVTTRHLPTPNSVTHHSMGELVAMGLCFGQQTYLKSSWNILDGLLVTISVIDILVSLVSDSGTKILGMLRVLRLLRTLRPL